MSERKRAPLSASALGRRREAAARTRTTLAEKVAQAGAEGKAIDVSDYPMKASRKIKTPSMDKISAIRKKFGGTVPGTRVTMVSNNEASFVAAWIELGASGEEARNLWLDSRDDHNAALAEQKAAAPETQKAKS